MPQLDALPTPLDVPTDMKGELVYLALPLRREGVTRGRLRRRRRRDELRRCREADRRSVRDHTNAADEPEAIQTGALEPAPACARKEAGEAYALLGVARVIERRSDDQVLLDRSYIAPQVAHRRDRAAVGARDAAARPDRSSARRRSPRAWAS